MTQPIRIPLDKIEAEYISKDVSEVNALGSSIELKMQAYRQNLQVEINTRIASNKHFTDMKVKMAGHDPAAFESYQIITEDGAPFMALTPKPVMGLSPEQAAAQKAAALAEANRPGPVGSETGPAAPTE